MASFPNSSSGVNRAASWRYRVPLECDCDADERRRAHEDLSTLDDDQLLVERCRVVVALALVTSRADREWLVARYRRVGAEQRRRARRAERQS
jgi:hypothetical protein